MTGTLELMRRRSVRHRQEAQQTFCDLAGTLDRIEAAGLELVEIVELVEMVEMVEMVLASTDDWDRFQARQWLAVSDWPAAHPDDPDVAAVRTTSDGWRRSYLADLRRCTGWGVFVLRDRG